jgi:hypothetical protein
MRTPRGSRHAAFVFSARPNRVGDPWRYETRPNLVLTRLERRQFERSCDHFARRVQRQNLFERVGHLDAPRSGYRTWGACSGGACSGGLAPGGLLRGACSVVVRVLAPWWPHVSRGLTSRGTSSFANATKLGSNEVRTAALRGHDPAIARCSGVLTRGYSSSQTRWGARSRLDVLSTTGRTAAVLTTVRTAAVLTTGRTAAVLTMLELCLDAFAIMGMAAPMVGCAACRGMC